MKIKERLQKHKTSIELKDFERVIKELESWCNRFHTSKFEIGYYTRTSTKIVKLFIEATYPERLDGYMLTGLIIRMSEMNIHLEYIEKSERYDSTHHEIKNCFVLKFEGSSLGKYYNPVYNILNNITGRRGFPPQITRSFDN